MEISKPDDLGDIANLRLTHMEAKQLLARVQREISTAQARQHAVRRPVCPCRDGICRVKDYRDHAVATLFGQVTLRLPRFRCAACGRIETGINWPSHCRSRPELDRLRAHLSDRQGGLQLLGELLDRDLYRRPGHIVGLTAYDDTAQLAEGRFRSEAERVNDFETADVLI
jgi:hypothetical protein